MSLTDYYLFSTLLILIYLQVSKLIHVNYKITESQNETSEWDFCMKWIISAKHWSQWLCPINGNDKAWVWTVKSECRILLSSGNINITASRLPLKYCKNIPSGMQPLHTVLQTTVTSITTQEVSFSYQSRYHFSTSAALTGISHYSLHNLQSIN